MGEIFKASEMAISRNPHDTQPVVSVCMITYNHEKYIAEAIEGVMMQETDFNVELVIGEDCSTDGTREIVRSYVEKYPQFIKAKLNERNLGVQVNFAKTLNECKGKYIALCEGDDYWTDPQKLKKQVEFMESNTDYSICTHRAYVVDPTGKLMLWNEGRRRVKQTYSLGDIVRGNTIPTASIMLRNRLVPELPAWFYDCPIGDWPLLVLYAQHGKVGLINQFMSVYRIHNASLSMQWKIADNYQVVMRMYEIIRQNLGNLYDRQIKFGISDFYLFWAAAYADQGEICHAKKYLLESITNCPINTEMHILDKLFLFCRLFTPKLYSFAKRIQFHLI